MANARPLPTASVVVADNFIKYATYRGLDPKPLLDLLGEKRESLLDPERRIPLSSHHALWEHAARALDDPGLPVQLAEQVRLESYHVMGFAVGSSRDGREALHRVCRYSVLFYDTLRWHLKEKAAPEVASIALDRCRGVGLSERLINESAVASCLSCFRQCSVQGFDPIEVTFHHPAPRDLSAHRRFFRAPIRFGASEDGFSFPAELLDTPLRGTNAPLSSFFERHAEQLLQGRAVEDRGEHPRPDFGLRSPTERRKAQRGLLWRPHFPMGPGRETVIAAPSAPTGWMT